MVPRVSELRKLLVFNTLVIFAVKRSTISEISYIMLFVEYDRSSPIKGTVMQIM